MCRRGSLDTRACCGAAWTCASCCAWGATLTLSYQRGAGSLAPVYALAPLSALGYTAPAALMARLVRDVSADAQGRVQGAHVLWWRNTVVQSAHQQHGHIQTGQAIESVVQLACI